MKLLNYILNRIVLTSAFALLTFGNCLFAQQYLKNPSVESETTGAFAPWGWFSCNTWSDPDIHPTQQGFSSYEGEMNALMRVRGKHYIGRTASKHPAETAEFMVNDLEMPLLKGSCYEFSAYIVFISNFYESSDALDPESHPVKFEIRGTNDTCPDTDPYSTEMMQKIETYELLGKTKLITNENWEKYTLSFTIEKQDYKYLLVRPIWDDANNRDKYNSIILVDNMNLKLLRSGNEAAETETLIYTGSNNLKLDGPNAASWDWFPKINLDAYNIQQPTLLDYTPQYTLTYRDNIGCRFKKNYLILPHCDSVFKKEYENEYTIPFKNFDTIQLLASKGERYEWEPAESLTLSDIQKPRVLDKKQESFIVNITTSFNCEFKEKFNLVFTGCEETLPNSPDDFVIDTLLDYNKSITLFSDRPWDGAIIWEPCFFLSNCDGFEPTAKPEYTTVYTKLLTDNFNCSYVEVYKVRVKHKIPNVITINNDKLNDVFKIKGLSEKASIKIYDKNGVLVYEADPYNETNWWEGQNLNKTPLNTGTFWYSLDVPLEDKPITGFVFLKR